MELAKWLLDAIGEEAEYLGPRTARDLHGRLYRDEGANVAAEPEIQDMLQSLASPLLGAIAGDSDRGYVLACSPAVTAERLRLLGEALTTGSTASAVDEDRESPVTAVAGVRLAREVGPGRSDRPAVFGSAGLRIPVRQGRIR